VTHDLSVVRHIANNICVMYLGEVVEMCPSKELFSSTLHPYSKALLSAIPSIDIYQPMQTLPLTGELTSPINPKPGCRFLPRCPYAQELCNQPQKLEEVSIQHYVACCRVREIN
jgi:peptide/nickel transport system ATP-binding protein